MAGIRLQKLLSRAGLASRRGAEELIRQGRVTLNGSVVREMGVLADPDKDSIRVDGQRLRSPDICRVLALNKPREVVTTLSDPEGRRSVGDLIPASAGRVFPVGRLDYHSEGLLLLTNDGELAQKIAAPGSTGKTYHAKVRGRPAAAALQRFARGLPLDGRRTRPARVRPLSTTGNGNSWIEVILQEGRKNQIRRMFQILGHPVQRLRRVKVGTVELADLTPGRCRALDADEISRLRRSVSRREPMKEKR